MFAFSATTGAVSSHHYDALYEAYILDEDVLEFLRANNPDALQDMLNKFQEALDRGLWISRRNDIYEYMNNLADCRP